MNRWSLEEMVKRDPENFLILLQQIIRKTKEVRGQRLKKSILSTVYVVHYCLSVLYASVCVRMCVQVQEQCQYELVAPLAIMFSSTLLQVKTMSIVQMFLKPLTLRSSLYHSGCFPCIKAHSIKRSLSSSKKIGKKHTNFILLYLLACLFGP